MLAAELENKDKDKQGYSGIDIEEAKRMLQNEDKYDKELYRQRIKRMHKEKKEKEKQLRRAKRAKVIFEFVRNSSLFFFIVLSGLFL